MAHAVLRGNIGVVHDRKGAAGGHYPVHVYDHGPVVERGILIEDVLYQTPVDGGVYAVAGLGDKLQGRVVLQDNEGARPGLSHPPAGLGYLVQGGGLNLLVPASQEDTGQEVVAGGGEIAAAYMQEETAYLGLENDYQRDDTDSENLSQDGRQQLHIQRLHHYPREIYQQDTDEDVEYGSAAHYPHHLVDQKTYQDDVDNVDYGYVDEVKHYLTSSTSPASLATASFHLSL